MIFAFSHIYFGQTKKGGLGKLLHPDNVIDQFRAYIDKIREMY